MSVSSFKCSYPLGSGLIKPQGEQDPGHTAAPKLFCHETVPDFSDSPSSTPELHFGSFNRVLLSKQYFQKRINGVESQVQFSELNVWHIKATQPALSDMEASVYSCLRNSPLEKFC